ncbi:hypothetical protein FCR2A7T_02220 [Flavobacterium cauense R2A-7]|uniref:Outer membrane protein with beta-barrel domain n=1 Tax=Flavobacterium cauense R2A-7 TaxID=1341154 RepID=V6S5S4_9FLAO|nr:porin family protein [Flavobacterium cauense]ESU21764.1 hypothetical protein FCR2A7T_02220 [Flavobacterium cauense R2A-7]KGO80997.1 hypothetical protein Q762_10165 [Flavobacterium cauense R2A-7]TWI12911.1 outer membrane protein with beta-barrel domain [Flavobacterium cauense R2A-7]
MHKFLLLTLFVIVPHYVFAQEVGAATKTENVKVVDSLFREDQFYVALSYNLVQNSPDGFKQFSFSPSISAGFMRDFPISKNRHWAIAPGIGYSYNNIKQFISTNDLFSDNPPVPSEDVKTRIVSHSIEVPLEIRWRNATYDSHKFWRVYTGLKARYVFNTNLKLESTSIGSETSNVDNNINKWQYGMYVSTGYNTWNIHVYYGLNPIFKNGSKLSDLNIGFMFYIL